MDFQMKVMIPDYVSTPIGDGYSDDKIKYVWGNHKGGGFGDGEWSGEYDDADIRGWSEPEMEYKKYPIHRMIDP